ncbi:EF hand domain containing protein [Nitzschia inconspicua]|uniref:EF hand domain containing protein n=1 Tax=Nitzschia inconspicua TaxID=303405 RepID=A0A9K3KFJ0_9STRA|nr:EF hand domain containing protein [Nitzschia inconspicua]
MIARTASLRSLARCSHRSAVTPNGSLVVVRSLSMYNPIKFDAVHPDKIFDEIDTTGSGTITRDEFKAALGRLRYSDLLKIHEAAVANLKAIDSKMEKLQEIEQDMMDLKEIAGRKKDVYNNIGMTTAADIDILFDQAKMTRQRLKNNVIELKGQLSQTRDAYNNIGFSTAADLAELFREVDDKKNKDAA